VNNKDAAVIATTGVSAFLLLAGMVFAEDLRREALVVRPDPAVHVIVDTDAGADDLMAIAFLLSRGDVRVEAITVVNGVAHVKPGAQNILRLLALAGHSEIPVYAGRERLLTGSAEFPAAWREAADTLPGVTLPRAAGVLQSEPAAQFLAKRFADTIDRVRGHKLRLLALGPLTNIAEALDLAATPPKSVSEMVIMGGAIGVPGNLSDGGPPPNGNTTAEWNMFVDPVAAARVFGGGWNAAVSAKKVPATEIRLVPLDATNKVPIDSAFLARIEREAQTPLARFVAQVLGTNRSLIAQRAYFAWDPLAAVAVVHPEILRTRCLAIGVAQEPHEAGRTIDLQSELQGELRGQLPRQAPNACVAVGADAQAFYRIFLGALETGTPPR
jgi:inosine-uridine nucleoside N-ribohydrolase